MFEDDVQIYLLGSFALLIGKCLIAESCWMRRKAKRLVQMLALHPRHKIHREELTEILFRQENAAQANANLSRVLYLARHALEPKLAPYAESRFLAQRNQVIELAAPEVNLWIDVDEFKQSAEKGLKTNDVKLLEQATALYAGDLLPDAIYEQWTVAPRQRLRALYFRVLYRLAENAEQAKDYARAHEWLDKVLACEAADEAAHRAKMRLYISSEQKTAALRQYENLKNLLSKEFETEPESKTEKLYREIHDSPNLTERKIVYIHTEAKTDVAALEAEQAYFKGVYLLNKRNLESLLLSLKFFNQAIAFNAKITAAYVGLANVYNLLGAFYGAIPSKAAHEKAVNAIEKAMRIDETFFDAHISLAYSYFADWNIKSCKAKFEECLRVSQESELMRQWYIGFLTYTGQDREAVAEGETIGRFVTSVPTMNAIGHAFYYAGKFAEAAAKYREVIEIEDGFAKAHLFLGHSLRELGKLDEALIEFRKAAQLSAGMQEKTALAHALARTGENAKAEYILRMLQTKKQSEYVSPCHVATVLLGLNRKDEALACLEKAAAEHSATLVFYPFDPLFESIKKHPRFQKILKTVKFNE